MVGSMVAVVSRGLVEDDGIAVYIAAMVEVCGSLRVDVGVVWVEVDEALEVDADHDVFDFKAAGTLLLSLRGLFFLSDVVVATGNRIVRNDDDRRLSGRMRCLFYDPLLLCSQYFVQRWAFNSLKNTETNPWQSNKPYQREDYSHRDKWLLLHKVETTTSLIVKLEGGVVVVVGLSRGPIGRGWFDSFDSLERSIFTSGELFNGQSRTLFFWNCK